MADTLQILLTGVAFGFSVSAPPGPVLALSAQRVVSRSWLSGWLVTLGATAADAVFFVVVYYGLLRLVSAQARGALFVPGGILMLYLAISAARTARAKGSPPLRERRPLSWTDSPFLTGLSMGLTNPYQLGWWVAIGGGMVAEYGGGIAAGFFAGILAWTLVFTAAVYKGVQTYARLAPYVSYAAAFIMGCFGGWFIWSGLSSAL